MWILRVVECALADAKWQWPDPESLGLVVQKVVYARNVESNSLLAKVGALQAVFALE